MPDRPRVRATGLFGGDAIRCGRRLLLRNGSILSALELIGPGRARAQASDGAEPNGLASDGLESDGLASVLVAGPEGGRLDRWADALAGPLGRALPRGGALRKQNVGGADGVTGANQFEARVSPDGQTALLAPGEAALAWLTGDPRARFDAARWIPVMSGTTMAVIAARVPLEALRHGAKLRIAAAGPAGPDLAALLGLDLLGVEAVPTFGLGEPDAVAAAFVNRVVDAVFLRGGDAERRLLRLTAAGAAAILTVGVAEPAAATRGDSQAPMSAVPPCLTDVLSARGLSASGPLFDAWTAAAAAARIDFALVLPQLVPASSVALWRRAAGQASAVLEINAVSDDVVSATTGPMLPVATADPRILLALRRWLAERFRWQPS